MFYYYFLIWSMGLFPVNFLEKDLGQEPCLGSTFVYPFGKGDIKEHYKMTDNI